MLDSGTSHYVCVHVCLNWSVLALPTLSTTSFCMICSLLVIECECVTLARRLTTPWSAGSRCLPWARNSSSLHLSWEFQCVFGSPCLGCPSFIFRSPILHRSLLWPLRVKAVGAHPAHVSKAFSEMISRVHRIAGRCGEADGAFGEHSWSLVCRPVCEQGQR